MFLQYNTTAPILGPNYKLWLCQVQIYAMQYWTGVQKYDNAVFFNCVPCKKCQD